MPAGDKRWQVYPANPSISSQLADALSLPPVIAQVLLNRGIRSLSDAKLFLDPGTADSIQFPDSDLDAAFSLIKDCINAKKTVLVYGDYDVDGMTSTALMVSLLREMGIKCTFYIPNRFKDGYGLSTNIIETLQAYSIDLLITLDCGVSNHAEIAQIKSAVDVDVLILDHHTLPETLPDATMLNPKTLPATHPLYGLCTVGIVYKFWEAFLAQYPEDLSIDLTAYLDLVALGTIADVSAMKGENRRLTSAGLRVLGWQKRPGIRALLEMAKFDKPHVSARDVGFTIAPRLNAAGRLADARVCVELLIESDEKKAAEIAYKLERLNQDRRQIGDDILAEAILEIENDVAYASAPVLVLASERWHAGVIGIIASRLVERYHKPCIMIAIEDGIARGSARTVGLVSIYEIISAASGHLRTFGGHKEAAGFSVLPENIAAFKEAVLAHAATSVSSRDLLPIIDVDAQLPATEMTMKLAETLGQLSPFGPQNPPPLFYCDDLKAVDFKLVGNGQHLKATFVDGSGQVVMDGIGFGLKDKLPLLYQESIHVAFHFEINEWQGRRRPQLSIVDIKGS